MNLPFSPIAHVSDIGSAKELFVSVDGPPLLRFPDWGLRVRTAQIQYHLHPAIRYEIHYQLPFYVLVHTFNGAKGRSAFGNEPLSPWIAEAHGSCLIPPGLPVKIIQDTPLEFAALGIDPGFFEQVAQATANTWAGITEPYTTNDPALASLFSEIRRTMIAEPLGIGPYLDALTHTLMTRLVTVHLAPSFEQSQGKEMLAPNLARRLVASIESQLSGPIKVSDLAEEAGLSRSHFSRAFSTSFGTTPQQFIMSRRIAAARSLLTDTDQAITDIAESCGFATPSHLTTAFKQELGLTPTAYRRALNATDSS